MMLAIFSGISIVVNPYLDGTKVMMIDKNCELLGFVDINTGPFHENMNVDILISAIYLAGSVCFLIGSVIKIVSLL